MPDFDGSTTAVDETGADEATHRVPVRRAPRVTLACSRCKARKQKCSGVRPVCTSCVKADAECVYERTIRPRYPGGKSLYIGALEERIAFLEARLPEHGRDHYLSPHESSTRRRESQTSVESPATDEDAQSSLVDGVAYLSLCASGATDTAPEPFYVGSSSGATIARLIQGSIFKASNSSIAGRKTDPQVLRPGNGHSPEDGPQPAPTRNPRDQFPPLPQAKALFTVFFERLHVRWPILNRKLFSSLFDAQADEGVLPVAERSILHLIYAISARFLQLMKKSCDVDPECQFSAAIAPMDEILEQHNLATVQFLTMLAIYGSRSPYGAGSWNQSRYAMTLCIELGLHRRPGAHVSYEEAEIRKRVFWASYCLDRMTTTTLGRTFAIADRDINAELPNEGSDFWYLTAESPGKHHWPNVSLFAHVIKLRQLQSRVFKTVWRVDHAVGTMNGEARQKLDRKVESIQVLLDAWLTRLPVPHEEVRDKLWMYDAELACHDSDEYFQLQYHKTVLSLYTALLPVLPVTDVRFRRATKSAAAVCVTYKSLNAHKTLSYTITALHSCFIAGLTLVYCLWRDPGLFDYEAVEATRACSLCLTVFGERWPGAVKYRDIFDAMSGSLLKVMIGEGSTGRGECERTRSPAPSLDMSSSLAQSQGFMPAITETAPEAPMPGTTFEEMSFEGQHGDAIYGAVKDAFMEVDGESQGGWHGWRMFTELMQTDMAAAPPSMDVRSSENCHIDSWNMSNQWQRS